MFINQRTTRFYCNYLTVPCDMLLTQTMLQRLRYYNNIDCELRSHNPQLFFIQSSTCVFCERNKLTAEGLSASYSISVGWITYKLQVTGMRKRFSLRSVRVFALDFVLITASYGNQQEQINNKCSEKV